MSLAPEHAPPPPQSNQLRDLRQTSLALWASFSPTTGSPGPRNSRLKHSLMLCFLALKGSLAGLGLLGVGDAK